LLERERHRDPATDGPADWMQLERDLMEFCIFRAPNQHLVDLIRHNQMPLAAASRALTKLGLPDDEIAVSEYIMLFELIAARTIDAAAIFLRNHLTALAEKNLARLKIVAVISEAQVGVSYLTPRESD
jgi:DNA-binding GntR family transcriptional regulator